MLRKVSLKSTMQTAHPSAGCVKMGKREKSWKFNYHFHVSHEERDGKVSLDSTLRVY